LVILEDGLVIFVPIILKHQLNDSLHITQFSSKWQVAPFYKMCAMFPGGKCY